eukprot:TRINITY_DN806_c0_g1_i1.p1 TRINITY_DN806_c0_g1~~TRINITY_DN806_c0_g1_i1.p1  ORF type:complete len:187 (+),score=15.21 TRINITY_DN806_c0_g1_i1:167-727(+)
MQKIVPLIVVILILLLCCALAIDCVLVLALFSASRAGSHWECSLGGANIEDDDAECSDRTAGLGISAAVFSFVVLLIFFVYFIATFFIKILHENVVLQILATICLILLALICAGAMIVSWALMANDIDDFRNGDRAPVNNSNADCDTPDNWAAALAFALFGMIAWFVAACCSAGWFSTRFCFRNDA